MPLIEVRDVSYRYSKKLALNGLSLTVEEGAFVAVIGGNGSGKSTLAKLLNAILLPSVGEVIIGGKSSSDDRNLFDIRQQIALVMQNPDSQIIAETVEDDVAFGPENLGLSTEQIGERVSESLKLCGVENLAKSSPSRLSGGQKQLVALAGALAMRPRCIVLDEATSMLDPEGRSLVLDKIEDLRRKNGMTVIMMTHRPEEVSKADVVHVLDGGRVVLSGNPKEVFSNWKRLSELGINVTMACKFKNLLKNNGIDLNQDIISMNKIVYELKGRRSGC